MKYVAIHGAPRSGTTWLGQIFNSHPDVAFRFQPLFSYRFRGALNGDSSLSDIDGFLGDLLATNDSWVLQRHQTDIGVQPQFPKDEPPSHMVMKHVRYHQLIRVLIRAGVKVVGIVRHPCGVTNSFLKTPREFPLGRDPKAEWRAATVKNGGSGDEFFGFEKWRKLAGMFLDLESEYDQEFRLVRYEELVDNPMQEVASLLEFAGLEMGTQTENFIRESQGSETEHPDTVFRKKDVKDRWKTELDASIADQIIREVTGTRLQKFLA